MTNCACRPGTYEDGWQQKWCEECLEADRQVWRDMMARWRENQNDAKGLED